MAQLPDRAGSGMRRPDNDLPTFADARRAARSVRRSAYGREAYDAARPRGITGILRGHGPLTLTLYIAARDGRLVWRGPDELALLQPPPGRTWRLGLGLRHRLLRAVELHWEMILSGLPPLAALTCAAGIAVLASDPHAGSARTWALLAVLAALIYVTAIVTAVVVTGIRWFFREFGRAPRAVDDIAESMVAGEYWSLVLCHQRHGPRAEMLLRLIRLHLDRIITRRVDVMARNLGARPERLTVTEALVCQLRGVTTADMRDVVRRHTGSPSGDGDPSTVSFLLAPGRPAPAVHRLFDAGGFFFWYLTGIAAVVGVCARFVADGEAAACHAAGCVDRPTTWTEAVVWLSQQMIPGHRSNLSPVTTQAWVFGWLMSLAALMGLIVAGVAMHRYVIYHGQAAEAMKARIHHGRTLVLIMVATTRERDAVLSAVRAVNDVAAIRGQAGPQTVHRLGTVSNADIVLAQAEQGAVGPGSAAIAAASLISHLGPDFLVVTGICFGLLPAEQHLGDILVCRQLRATDHRRLSEPDVAGDPPGEAIRSDYVTPSTALLSSFRATGATWTRTAIHYGVVLSASTLVDSQDVRDRLRRQHPDAAGGEMEGAGVYAAAAPGKVDWIVVKGISDWGAHKNDARQDLAARNAADFVVYTIGNGEMDTAVADRT